MRPYKICCITYKGLDKLVRSTVDSHPDPEIEIDIVEGLQDEILHGLRSAEDKGFEVAVAGGANLKIAREEAIIPVLEYQLSPYDWIEAIERARRLGSHIAICTYKTPMDTNLSMYLSHRFIDCENIIYETDRDLHEQILAARGSVIIGAAHAVETAVEYGMQSVSIYPGPSAVLGALGEAKSLAAQLRRQDLHARFAQAVITHSTNGLVLVDSEWNVIEYNSAAREIFGLEPHRVKGRNVHNVLPQSGAESFHVRNDRETVTMQVIRNEDVLCKWVRLYSPGHDAIGSLGIFSPMSDIVRAQMEHQRRQAEELADRGFSARAVFSGVIGSSPAVSKARDEARIYAQSDSSVLISGETGTGKELFAQSIHNESSRSRNPFIAINCAALPEQLLESELFGYDEGAFTGGRRGGKKGLIEFAHTGTLFLDEIGELPLPLQSRLLRFLQEKEIMHVGGERVIPVDVRVIAATNRDLENIPPQQFRRDLYYRLGILEINIPPLRERGNDAAELFEYFVRGRAGRNLAERMDEALRIAGQILELYDWPGNIRELQNVCERFCLYMEARSVTGEKYIRRCIVRAIREDRLVKRLLLHKDADSDAGRKELYGIMQNILGYSKTHAAQVLGISRTTLWRRGG